MEMGPVGLDWGLKGVLWMKRALFAGLEICRSAVGTANGRRKKNAMIVTMMSRLLEMRRSDGERRMAGYKNDISHPSASRYGRPNVREVKSRGNERVVTQHHRLGDKLAGEGNYQDLGLNGLARPHCYCHHLGPEFYNCVLSSIPFSIIPFWTSPLRHYSHHVCAIIRNHPPFASASVDARACRSISGCTECSISSPAAHVRQCGI